MSARRDGSGGRGLRPLLPIACRTALRGEASALADHVRECPRCERRQRAAAALGGWLRSSLPLADAPPELSEAGRAEAMLASIRERAVDAAESGPLGAWLERELPAVPEPGEPVAAEEALESSVAPDLAERLVHAPAAPTAAVWSEVRRSILDGVRVGEVADAAPRVAGTRRLAVAGLAAAAVVAVAAVLFTQLTTDRTPAMPAEGPVIVFADVDRAPASVFSVTRYGVRR